MGQDMASMVDGPTLDFAFGRKLLTHEAWTMHRHYAKSN
jgi:hypothetical protein